MNPPPAMSGFLVPALLLLVLPALYFAHRLDLLRRPRVRWVGGILLSIAVVGVLPFGGVDFLYLKRLDLLIAAATALLMVARQLEFPWALQRRTYRAILAALAVLATLTYLNFFAFHGQRTFIHLHDLAHYYLGSKYYAELGYEDLYVGMLRAEAEVYEDHFKTLEARDLATDRLVPIQTLLAGSDRVRESFDATRWAEFRQDVAWFRDALGRQYADVLRDHGFNPSPVWVLAGGTLANLVPAASDRGILLLTLLDPLLLIAVFVVVGRVFDLDTMLLGLIYFCVLFGATFGWTGGAFLRYPWLVAIILAACQLHRGRSAAAAVFLGLATGLRLFPGLLALPLLAKAVWESRRARALPRGRLAFFGTFVATLALLVALTGLLPGGFQRWLQFESSMQRQLETVAPNIVGVTQVLDYRPADEMVSAEEFDALNKRRSWLYRLQLAILMPAALLLVTLVSRSRSDLEALALGICLLPFSLNLAAYYYAVLLLLVLAHRSSSPSLALLFAAEAICYTLQLFEGRIAALYAYRTLVLLLLFAALYLEPLRLELRQLGRREKF